MSSTLFDPMCPSLSGEFGLLLTADRIVLVLDMLCGLDSIAWVCANSLSPLAGAWEDAHTHSVLANSKK